MILPFAFPFPVLADIVDIGQRLTLPKKDIQITRSLHSESIERHSSTNEMQRFTRSLARLRRRSTVASIRSNHSQIPSQTDSHSRTTSFGFKTVPEDAKESLVKNVFDSVASKYDFMNDATSFGVHRLWKDTFVSSLQPGRKSPMKCIDVAGGTGDIALRILDYAREKHYDRETTVEVVDINPQMLKEGFQRFKQTMYHNSKRLNIYFVQHSDSQIAPQISFHEANAQDLGSDKFKDNSYDLYTIAFGIRNCTSISAVLKEAHRVLKPGGTFACLEFSRVNNPMLSMFA